MRRKFDLSNNKTGRLPDIMDAAGRKILRERMIDFNSCRCYYGRYLHIFLIKETCSNTTGAGTKGCANIFVMTFCG